MTHPTDTTAPTPTIQVRGNPNPEDVAAIVAVLTTASDAGGDELPDSPQSRWASHTSAVRAPLTPGRGAWRHSNP